MDDSRTVERESAAGCPRLLPEDGRRHGARVIHGRRRPRTRTIVLAARLALFAAVADSASTGSMDQPVVDRHKTGLGIGFGGPRVADREGVCEGKGGSLSVSLGG